MSWVHAYVIITTQNQIFREFIIYPVSNYPLTPTTHPTLLPPAHPYNLPSMILQLV